MVVQVIVNVIVDIPNIVGFIAYEVSSIKREPFVSFFKRDTATSWSVVLAVVVISAIGSPKMASTRIWFL